MRLMSALVTARLRAAGPRHAILVAALAVAGILPTLVAAFSIVTADAAVVRALGEIPAAERSLTASAASDLVGPADLDRADPGVRSAMSPLVSGPIRRELLFRALVDGSGTVFAFGAVDDLSTAVRLTSGRLPRSCTPERCEAVAIVDRPEVATRLPDPQRNLGIVVVGQVTRIDPLVMSGVMAPRADAVVLLTRDVSGAASVSALALIDRARAWVGRLDTETLRSEPDEWERTVARLGDRLDLVDDQLAVASPGTAVRDVTDRAAASTARFDLLAGGCSVLLLGTAVAGGAALRPGHGRFVEALRRRGLPARGLRLVTAGEALALAGAGTAVGVVAGAGVTAAMAAAADLPPARTALDAVGQALPATGILLVAAFGLVLTTLWPTVDRDRRTDPQAGWRLLSYATAASLVAVLLVVSRGASTGSGDALLTALPALVLVTVALLGARLWPWALRSATALLPRRAIGARLAVSGLIGRPLLAAATVALLVAGVGAAGFAVSYRSTLHRGAGDQAAHTVPADLRVTASTEPGSSALAPLNLAPAADFATAAGPGAKVLPVLRLPGSIRVGTGPSDIVQMVGIDPDTSGAIRRWSSVVGGSSPAAVTAAIDVPGTAPGRRLPGDNQLRVDVARPPEDDVTAWVRADDGRERAVPLTAGKPAGAGPGAVLTGRLPAGSWVLTSLVVAPPFMAATIEAHGEAEADSSRAARSGRIELGAVRAGDVTLADPWSGWRGDTGQNVEVRDDGEHAVLDYRLDTGSAVAQADPGAVHGQAGSPLPVAADPRTAAAGPLVTITLNSRPVIARVVLTLPRFPTLTGRFVVADRRALATLADRGEPGSGQPQELWLDLPTAVDPQALPAWLGREPFIGLAVTSAAATEATLRTDPVGVGAIALLLVAAGLTGLVALAALVLMVAAERTEDADGLTSWETEGVPRRTLRVSLWVRAALVAALGVPLGIGAGLALTRLTARLVPLTAGAGSPQPPLVPEAGLGSGLLMVLAGLAAALAAAWLVAARSFTEPLPPLSGGDL
jgi:hypothetical protein